MSARTLRWLTLALPLAVAGCDDGDTPAVDPPLEVIFPDAGPVPDAAAPDAAVVDAAPPPILDAPEAWVYPDDPITDEGEVSKVVLTRSTDPEGRLTSDWVQVFNCLNEEGGVSAMPDFGGFQLTVFLCRETQTVRPDPDGHYLSIQPPAEASDPNDPFAEVMMYHHVNLAHDYFKGTHGFDGLDFPLPAIVNLQLRTEPALPIPGFEPGPDGWIPFANAAFFPRETWEQFAAQFGLPPRDTDSIIFGQGDHDFAYDARVIVHEYTHAVIGTSRLQAPAVVDRFGLDNSPRSMNEGLADYFAATLADDPVVGTYGIGALAPDLVRDLSEPKKCPADLSDEIHANGKVIGSALWAVRAAIGAEATDDIVWAALEQFGVATNHQEAGELMLAAAVERGLGDQVEPILTDFGLLGCERVQPFGGFRASTAGGGGLVVEGKQSLGLFGLGNGAPAYRQFKIDVPAGTPAIELTWRQSSQQGLGGGGPIALDAALRVGEPVGVSANRMVEYALDHRLTPALDGAVQRMVLTGDCLPADGGEVFLLWVNDDNAAATIVSTDLTVLDAVPDDGAVETCGAVAPMPDAGLPEPDADLPEADAGLDAGLPEPDAAP